jgi:hypothetical protein
LPNKPKYETLSPINKNASGFHFYFSQNIYLIQHMLGLLINKTTISFQPIVSLFKYSLRLAPYNRCLEFTTNVEDIVIIEDAPPENNCKNTICEAPPKIIKEVA